MSYLSSLITSVVLIMWGKDLKMINKQLTLSLWILWSNFNLSLYFKSLKYLGL